MFLPNRVLSAVNIVQKCIDGQCSNLDVIWTRFTHKMLHFGLIGIHSNHIFYYFNPKLYLLYMCWNLQSAFCCHMSNTTWKWDSSLIWIVSFCFIFIYLGQFPSLSLIFLHLSRKTTNIRPHLSIFWYRPNWNVQMFQKCSFPSSSRAYVVKCQSINCHLH